MLHSTGMYPVWTTAIIIVLMSWLMVSDLPIFSLKFKNFSLLDTLSRYIIIAAAIVLIAIFRLPGIALTIVLYVLMAIFKVMRVK